MRGIVDVIAARAGPPLAAGVRFMTLEEVPARLHQALGGIDMGVENDGLGMDPPGARGQIGGEGCLRPHRPHRGQGAKQREGGSNSGRSVHEQLLWSQGDAGV
jgi:hypothetical protein